MLPRSGHGGTLFLALLIVLSCLGSNASGQSTQCLISGLVRDLRTGEPVKNATVTFQSADQKTSGTLPAGRDGSYSLPLLPPGVYRIKAEASGYQPREFDQITLAVAAFLDINFDLRPITDVFEQDIAHSIYFSSSQDLLNFYGPDIDTSRSVLFSPLDEREGRLTTSVSDVIDPQQIEELPLTGRDIYTALLLEPGVNADPGATRGLGFSVNGQRPSSSSFLLDGVETNAYLISGPLLTPAPEMVQEYRVSTNNFSAEYGGTSGYIANAVTTAAGPRWNGQLYFFLLNGALNANGFQENLSGFPRAPLRQIEPGFVVGGPIGRKLVLRRRILASNSFEYLRVRTRLDPLSFLLPTAATYQSGGNTEGGELLRQYPAVGAPSGPAGEAEPVTLSPPSSLNQYLGLSRLDADTPDGRHHFLLRAAVSNFDRPDYYWTPYTAFTSGFSQNALNIAAGTIDNLTPRLINESRVSWGRDLLQIGDNNHGLPTLSDCADGDLCLPSNTSPFSYRNLGHTWQALDNMTVLRASHTLKFGAGFLNRDLGGYLRNGADGSFGFSDLSAFLSDAPYEYTTTVARSATNGLSIPDYDRSYLYRQFYLFAQDSWRMNDRLALNFGLRYEYSGAPVNVGAQKDTLVALGPGSNLQEQIMGATFKRSMPGDQPLYTVAPNNWAPRFGISWSPWRGVPILLRGSYGIFYDRPFDNLWQTIQNNSVVSASSLLTSGSIPWLQLAQAGPASFPGLATLPQSFQPTLFQPHLREGMVQSAFTGVQARISQRIAIEVNGLASHGRRLLTTDFVNRDYSVPQTFTNLFGQFNPDLPPLSYRANEGFSNYDAVTALLKFTRGVLSGQIAYTWSHSIDNQSDPISGDYNLEFSSVSAGGSYYGRASFVGQFESGADIGNSDFDQRQSLVFELIARIPFPRSQPLLYRILGHWQVAGLASLRSGLPFNVYANPNSLPLSNLALINDRADLIDPNNVYTRQPIPGGALILNPAAFAAPADGQIGTAGRNVFAGPGTISADLSISRGFQLPGAPERMRLVLRADAYNFLNHANLYVDAENPQFGTPQFGTAQYGTTGVQSNFPVQVPLTPTPREIQLGVRLEF